MAEGHGGNSGTSHERSRHLEEYTAHRPPSAGSKPRSLINKVAAASGGINEDDDEWDARGNDEWVMDGWGEEPSVSDVSRQASSKLNKFLLSQPKALPNANAPARRVCSAGPSMQGKPRLRSAELRKRLAGPQTAPVGRRSPAMPPVPRRVAPVELANGEESDEEPGSSTSTPKAPRHQSYPPSYPQQQRQQQHSPPLQPPRPPQQQQHSPPQQPQQQHSPQPHFHLSPQPPPHPGDNGGGASTTSPGRGSSSATSPTSCPIPAASEGLRGGPPLQRTSPTFNHTGRPSPHVRGMVEARCATYGEPMSPNSPHMQRPAANRGPAAACAGGTEAGCVSVSGSAGGSPVPGAAGERGLGRLSYNSGSNSAARGGSGSGNAAMDLAAFADAGVSGWDTGDSPSTSRPVTPNDYPAGRVQHTHQAPQQLPAARSASQSTLPSLPSVASASAPPSNALSGLPTALMLARQQANAVAPRRLPLPPEDPLAALDALLAGHEGPGGPSNRFRQLTLSPRPAHDSGGAVGTGTRITSSSPSRAMAAAAAVGANASPPSASRPDVMERRRPPPGPGAAAAAPPPALRRTASDNGRQLGGGPISDVAARQMRGGGGGVDLVGAAGLQMEACGLQAVRVNDSGAPRSGHSPARRGLVPRPGAGALPPRVGSGSGLVVSGTPYCP